MQENVWLLIALGVIAIVVTLWLIRRRYGRNSLPRPTDAVSRDPVSGDSVTGDAGPVREVAAPPVTFGSASAPIDIPPPVPVEAPIAPLPVPETQPVAAAPVGPPDDLSKMKGVGPKLVALLGTLGVSRYDQIAAWGPADIAAIDARLGTFQGRVTRDKWVEQATYLANGDIAGFEAQFGKL